MNRRTVPHPLHLTGSLLVGALALASACHPGPPAVATAPTRGTVPLVAALAPDLVAAITASESEAQGHHGVAVLHVESGERGAYNGAERFPMQSVFTAVVAHRTGTSDETDDVKATTNDVGFITLPGKGGHVIVAAFLTNARGDDGARAHALARIGRAVYDHYAPR